MASIKSFSTKNDVAAQVAATGVTIALPFTVTNLKVSEEPIEKEKLVDAVGSPVSYLLTN